jgi:putative intracellular protease/amidase
MKKTAILLYDLFSNYELSVALSILVQGEKKYDIFCKNEVAVSEEGLHVKRNKSFSELVISDYDSFLLTGCMDLRNVIDDECVLKFIQNFNLTEHIVASISSSPVLLLKAGVIKNQKFLAAVMKEGLLEEGWALDQLTNMRDITELKNDDGTEISILADGNLLTAIGFDFVNFGIKFGEMLNLQFESGWYK